MFHGVLLHACTDFVHKTGLLMSSLCVKLVRILYVSIHARIIPRPPLSLHQVIFVSISILGRLGEDLAILATTGSLLAKEHIVL